MRWIHRCGAGATTRAGRKRRNACESNISCYFSLTNAVLTFLLPRSRDETTIKRRTRFYGGRTGIRVVMGGGNLMVALSSEIDGLVFFCVLLSAWHAGGWPPSSLFSNSYIHHSNQRPSLKIYTGLNVLYTSLT